MTDDRAVADPSVVSCPVTEVPVGLAAEDVDVAAEAEEFLGLLYDERRRRGLSQRLTQVREEIALTGTYRHTREELVYGAKVAWRQSVRCVGRVRWAGLKVRDRRDVTTVKGIVRELAAHLTCGDNGGRIQSVMTVFAPDRPGVGPRARIWNDQLIRYCGHLQGDGSVLGDPAQVPMTEAVRRLGWRPPPVPGRFDLLPWVVETAAEDPTVVEVPRDLVREVALSHPSYPWFADLMLRWHALPVISNMRMRVGGVDYGCAPFNGHYLSDEIGTRNMGDPERYDQLRVVASALGLDSSREETLWREHAVLVINQAVLHSFKLAGVRMSDPHTESELFMKFCAQEEKAGRPVYADWSWLNGSVGWAALHAVHHRYYDSRVPNPNLWQGDRAYQPGGAMGLTLRERHEMARQED